MEGIQSGIYRDVPLDGDYDTARLGFDGEVKQADESDSVKRLEMIVDEGKRLMYLDTENYLRENQSRVYKNKKLCEYLVWQGKTMVHDIIDNINI